MGKFKKYIERLDELILELDSETERSQMQSIRSRYIELEKGKPLVSSYLITISFDDNKLMDIGKLPDIIIKKLQRTYVNNYVFSIEQRGETKDDYHGIHTHIIIDLKENYKKSIKHIKREFYNSFKGFVSGEAYVDVRAILGGGRVSERSGTVEDDARKRAEIYISGCKADPDKSLKCNNDILFREHYKLLNIYRK